MSNDERSSKPAGNIFCLRGLDPEIGCSHQPFSIMQTQTTKSNRRDFLRTTGLGLGALGLATAAGFSAQKPNLSFAAPSKIRLGTVTYNLAKDWDLATIIKNCQDAGFEGVELRTTHAHGVEVTLNKAQREEVKQRVSPRPRQPGLRIRARRDRVRRLAGNPGVWVRCFVGYVFA